MDVAARRDLVAWRGLFSGGEGKAVEMEALRTAEVRPPCRCAAIRVIRLSMGRSGCITPGGM
jgi:hypothetical protein